jgi:23S rRNA (uracil1939-C5)-methyltransferase
MRDDLALTMGQRLEGCVTGLSHDGRGVVPLGATVAFVTGALPGERVQLRLVHRSRRHWHGALEELLAAAPDRCRPPCILAESCGGCSLQHWEVAAQRPWKRQKVVEALQRIGHFSDVDPRVAMTLGQGDGVGYRNRAILPLERREDGRLRAGYYRSGSHSIVNLNRCPVLDPRLDALIAPLKLDLEASAWPVDRHLSGGGGLRHLALRLGHHSGEVLLTLVSSRIDLEGLEERAQLWMERWPQVVGVCVNLQDRPTNALMGPRTVVVAGRGWLRERFAGLDLEIAPDTFFQVNTPMAELLVPIIQQVLADQPQGLLIDAYCGIGTFGLPMAAAGWRLEGIDVGPASIALARRNAERNGLSDSCRFHEGSVGELLADRLSDCDALLLDPPRKGLEPQVLATILAEPPRKLLYLSCDPATLARDLAQLAGDGGPYRLASVQPLDFFPHTSHVESLAVLERV